MHSTAEGCRSNEKATGTGFGIARWRRPAEKTGGSRMAAAGIQRVGACCLLNVGVERQVSRQFRHESRAAPLRANAARIDSGERAVECRSVIASEGVAVGLTQVGVDIAQVEREHLVGEPWTDVPGRIVGVIDAGSTDQASQAVEAVAGAEPLIAALAGNIDGNAVRKRREGVLDSAGRVSAICAGVQKRVGEVCIE